MTIGDMLKLKPGQTVKRMGEIKTVQSICVVPEFRNEFDKYGNLESIDSSYVELIYYDSSDRLSALYSGPPIRGNLDIKEFEHASQAKRALE